MRRIWFGFLVVIAAATIGRAQNSPPQVSVTRWPQDRTAAISLSFDDGIDTHLDVVGPILQKHHLNGTFFVATGMGPWEKRKVEWQRLAQQGNELANHTVHHPCLLPEITPHSQDYTPDMMEAEIRDAAQELSQVVEKKRGLTFAYPCGNMSFGKPEHEVKNAALYAQYVSQYAFGARAVGSGANSPEELNVLAVNDLGSTEGKNFPALLDLAQPGIQRHNWGVFCFHGVGGDWLAITPEALDELAGYLQRHAEIWTATFGDVLRYVQERKASSISVEKHDSQAISLKLSWPMDRNIYDVPLTIKVDVPPAWNDLDVVGDGKKLTARIVPTGNRSAVLVDVPSQAANVQIRKR